MSAQYVALVVRLLCLSTPLAPGFGCSLLMSCFSLERACHGVFGFQVLLLPTPTPQIDAAWAHLRWSIASPIPLEFESRYHDVLRVYSLAYVSILHSVAPQNMQYSPLHFRWHVWNNFFSLFLIDHVWASYKRTGKTQDSRTSFCIWSFWNLWASENFLQTIAVLFYISFSRVVQELDILPMILNGASY